MPKLLGSGSFSRNCTNADFSTVSFVFTEFLASIGNDNEVLPAVVFVQQFRNGIVVAQSQPAGI